MCYIRVYLHAPLLVNEDSSRFPDPVSAVPLQNQQGTLPAAVRARRGFADQIIANLISLLKNSKQFLFNYELTLLRLLHITSHMSLKILFFNPTGLQSEKLQNMLN